MRHRRPGTAGRTLAPAGRVCHRASQVTPRVPLGDVPTMVVELLASSETDLQLRVPAAIDEEAQRHDRQAFRLRLAQQLVYLVAMEEQLPRPLCFVVEAVAP